MRYAIRVLVILAALAVLLVNPVMEGTSTGEVTIYPLSVVVDVIALAAILASLLTWRRPATA